MSDLNFIANLMMSSSSDKCGPAVVQLVHTGSAQHLNELVQLIKSNPSQFGRRDLEKYLPWDQMFRSACLQEDHGKFDAVLSLARQVGTSQWSSAFSAALGTSLLDHVSHRAEQLLSGSKMTGYEEGECLTALLSAAAVVSQSSLYHKAWTLFGQITSAQPIESLLLPWESLSHDLVQYGDVQGVCRLTKDIPATAQHRLLSLIYQTWPVDKIAPVLETCVGSNPTVDDLMTWTGQATLPQRGTVQWFHIMSNNPRSDVVQWLWSASPYKQALQEQWPDEQSLSRVAQDIIRHLKSPLMHTIIEIINRPTSNPLDLVTWYENLSRLGCGTYETKTIAARLLNGKRLDLISALHDKHPASIEKMFTLYLESAKPEEWLLENLVNAIEHIKTPALQAVLCGPDALRSKSPALHAHHSRLSLMDEVGATNTARPSTSKKM